MDKNKCIHVHLDERALWTADLYHEDEHVANLGGSYPKSSSAIMDAKKTWGDLEVQLGGDAPSSFHYLESLPEIEISDDPDIFNWPKF